MQAIGNDGQWHDWHELSAEEQDAWMRAMSLADQDHEVHRRRETAPTLTQALQRYEQKERFIY